ncbi:MAG: type II CAAX endopeptidase family protein [Cytophagales bacterium]|nr:type II CAAX endopeptidase family protein [Cytophagales bacterium]
MNYALSWTFLYPCYQAILNAEEGTFPWLVLIGIPGGFGPSIAAVIVVALNEGKKGVGRLLRRFKSFKVHWRWYLFVIALPVGLYYLATISTVLFGFDLGNPAYGEGLKMALVYLLLALPFGPLMEELGWRGYMLPALLQRYHVFKSSLILGFCWALWHLASFTFPGAAIPAVFEVNAWTVLLYFLTIMSETLVFSYVYLKTKGSLIMVILLHAAFNAGSTIVLTVFPDISEQVDQRMYLYIIHIVMILLAATGLFGFSRKIEEDLTY